MAHPKSSVTQQRKKIPRIRLDVGPCFEGKTKVSGTNGTVEL